MYISTPPPPKKFDTRSIKQKKTGLISVFLSLDWLPIKTKEPNLPYYVHRAEERERTDRVMSFPNALAQNEVSTVSSRF